MNVPFADLKAQYLSIKGEVDAAIAAVIDASAFVRGPFVEKFEEEFARANELRHCVSCANGTDSLFISMRALGVKPGDEVICPAMSWISSSETITQAGGRVVFCDIDPKTYTLDPAKLEAKITPRTVGIIPVHLYGQPCDMDPIMAIARRRHLWVLEDCAQAHFARYKGRLVGSFGNAASFSFYPGKNLGAMGDAGAICTNDEALATHMAKYARHGGLKKGDHEIEGINSRLDGIHAAVLSVKLRHVHAWTKRRQEIGRQYDALLAGRAAIQTPTVGADREHVYHLYVVRVARRQAVVAHLKEHGVHVSINYPVALPFLPAYKRLEHKPADFENAYRLQEECISLPMFAEMSDEQVRHVAARLVEAE